MKLRYKLISVGAILAGVFLWGRCSRTRTPMVPVPATVLPKNDQELITYNDIHHAITVTTAKGTVTQYSRNPSVELRKDGTVKIDSHTWGLELRPFLGAGYSDTGRIYAGAQFFYFHSFDAGTSLGWTPDNRKPALQPMLSVAYNFWSNTSLNVGVNPISFVGQRKPEIAVFLSVRL